MKIQFSPKEFLRLFKLAASAAASRDIKPILQNVKIVADKEVGAILMATDTEVSIRIHVYVNVVENGEAVLPIKTLRTILDSTKEKILTMESVMAIPDIHDVSESESTDDDDAEGEYVRYIPPRRGSCSVVLYGQHERHELCTSDPDEFPNVEEFTAEAYHELETDDMKTLIQRTVFAIDKDNPRYALGGVCFEGQIGHDVITAIATDGRRLAVQTTDRCVVDGNPIIGDTRKVSLEDGTEQERIDYPIVGVPALNLLTKVLNDKAFKKQKKHIYSSIVKMAFTDRRVFFHCESAQGNEKITIVSRLLEGRFPKWQRIVPDKTNPMACAEVNSGALLAAVKNVQGVTTDLDSGIYVTFENGQMTVEGRGKEKGNAMTTIAADCKGKATSKIDHSFLTSMLKTLDDTSITIRYDGDNPLLIETDDENYTYVVMPMNGDDNAPSPNQAWSETGIDLTALHKQENEEQLAQMRQDVEAKVAAQLADADDESGYEPDTESDVPIDGNGEVTTDYYHNVMPNVFVNPTTGTSEHFDSYNFDYPVYCPDEHLFRAEFDHDDTTWTMEWDCVPGRRIVPDWRYPKRITSPKIPLDENGYTTWEYLESLGVGVPLSLIDPATNTRVEYEMELPRFLPEESLFRTTGKTTDGQSIVVEWACLLGKRRLVATKTEGIGTIDDWARPSRIIPLDEFTDEIIERGGLIAAVEEKHEVCQWCGESRCACDYEDEPSEWATADENESETEFAIELTEAERERVRTQTRLLVPVNNEGYVNEAYFSNLISVIVVDDSENETYREYVPNAPRYYHAESLYRAEARTAEFEDDGERLRVILEWDSFDTKMSLAHWQNPDRIIPLVGNVSESAPEPMVETELESDAEEGDEVEWRFEELTQQVDSIVETYNDEAVAFFAPELRYQKFLSDMMTVILEYKDVFAWLTQRIQTVAEPESSDDNPVPPREHPYVVETISRPSNKPMALPKLKQKAMRWT